MGKTKNITVCGIALLFGVMGAVSMAEARRGGGVGHHVGGVVITLAAIMAVVIAVTVVATGGATSGSPHRPSTDTLLAAAIMPIEGGKRPAAATGGKGTTIASAGSH